MEKSAPGSAVVPWPTLPTWPEQVLIKIGKGGGEVTAAQI